MPIKDTELGKILLAQNYVSEADLKNAETITKEPDTGPQTNFI